MSQDLNIRELGSLLVVTVALALLSGKVPDMVAGIVSGSGAHYGAGHLGLGMIVGAAMMGGRMAATAASAVATGGIGAAATIGGGGQALRAAFQSAQQHVGNGVGGNGGSHGSGGGLGGGYPPRGVFCVIGIQPPKRGGGGG